MVTRSPAGIGVSLRAHSPPADTSRSSSQRNLVAAPTRAVRLGCVFNDVDAAIRGGSDESIDLDDRVTVEMNREDRARA